MKFGFTIALEAPDTYPALLKGDVYKNIDKAVRYGAETVELHLHDPKLVDVQKLARVCKEKGISVSAIGTGLACASGFSLTSSDENVRNQTIKRLEEYTDMAAVLGSVVIIGSIRGKAADPKDYEGYENLLIRELRIAADYAQKKNVTLVLEVINHYELTFLNKVGQVKAFLEKLDRPNVKMHLDTYHMNLEETSMTKPIYECGSWIGHVHAADNTRSYPGSGTLDFDKITKALQNIGYEGAFSMECLPVPDSDTAICEGLATLKKTVNVVDSTSV